MDRQLVLHTPIEQFEFAAGINPQINMVQLNGKMVLSPPNNWEGPPPSSSCELFIRQVPKNLSAHKLMQPFFRFGRIYEMRLPMDYNQGNRGYAYVKYTNEEDALCAMEVLRHYYVLPHKRLEIVHSYEKCRLFVTNIPRHLNVKEIEAGFREVFPTMLAIQIGGMNGGSTALLDKPFGTNCTAEVPGLVVSSNEHNRGNAYVQFKSHVHALEAKKSTTPGIIRRWGRDLKVVWANNDRERNTEVFKEPKTLLFRHVDLSVNEHDIFDKLVRYVPRGSIRKITKDRSNVFISFATREAAEICLQRLQGSWFRNGRLDIEWAKPSARKSMHNGRISDFDVVLRLKCLANGWQIPIVIFGTYYPKEHIQYCAVLMRDGKKTARAVFCILETFDLLDIHSRLCEVVCVMITMIGTFPDYNYAFYVEKDCAHLLGMVAHNTQVDFIQSNGNPVEYRFNLQEIVDLSWASASLVAAPEEELLKIYLETFRKPNMTAYLAHHWFPLPDRIFGTIRPSYRSKQPLKHNLNDTQIVLALCHSSTGSNLALPTQLSAGGPVTEQRTGYDSLRYVPLNLLHNGITQFTVDSKFYGYVQYGGSPQFSGPVRAMICPPVQLNGCTYAVSVKQLPPVMEPELPPLPAIRFVNYGVIVSPVPYYATEHGWRVENLSDSVDRERKQQAGQQSEQLQMEERQQPQADEE